MDDRESTAADAQAKADLEAVRAGARQSQLPLETNPLMDALERAAEDENRKRRRGVLIEPELYLLFFTREVLARIRDPYARKVVLELADALDWALRGWAVPKRAPAPGKRTPGRRPGTVIETTADLLAPLAAAYIDDLGKPGRRQLVRSLKAYYLENARALLKAKGKLLRAKGKKKLSERTIRQALFGGTSSSQAKKKPGKG